MSLLVCSDGKLKLAPSGKLAEGEGCCAEAECGFCLTDTKPTQIQVEIAGYAPGAACCSSVNGTYILDFVSDAILPSLASGCLWRKTGLSFSGACNTYYSTLLYEAYRHPISSDTIFERVLFYADSAPIPFYSASFIKTTFSPSDISCSSLSTGLGGIFTIEASNNGICNDVIASLVKPYAVVTPIP